ncbi:MAG: phosphatase PAP2 family protein [Candidatus Scalindua sp.]|nr:phosphatase PAP2 family protein [Candidatus Scalindua sp.]
MFQTEIIHFLQLFESSLLNLFFKAINSAGYDYVYIPLLLIIIFGISFRKGLYLFHVSLWTVFATIFLKEYFALPRPCDVDFHVKLINRNYQNSAKFDSMGASHFLGRLPDDVVTYFRNIKYYSYGFPSGHVSLNTALWISISQLFQQLWVKTLAIALIVLMPITRMYLGEHFLADVLGGLLIGVFFMLLFYYTVYKSDLMKDTFSRGVTFFPFSPKALILLSYFFIIPLIIYWMLPPNHASFPGNLLGINVSFILLTVKGIPLDGGTPFQKTIRVLIALFLFFNTNFLLKKLGFNESPSLAFIRASIVSFTMIYVTTGLSVKLHLYQRNDRHNKHKAIKKLHKAA